MQGAWGELYWYFVSALVSQSEAPSFEAVIGKAEQPSDCRSGNDKHKDRHTAKETARSNEV